MRFSHFCIDRPIFATVLSILIVLLGAAAYFTLPVAQYPEIAPPTIEIRASYPGASAEVVSDTVATPIEQEINGVEDMLYMASQATGDGQLGITVTFALGTDLDTAQVLVQNRVAVAEVAAAGGGAPDRRDGAEVVARHPDGDPPQLARTARATRSTSPTTRRCRCATCSRGSTASATCAIFGARDYAMRIWLDPEKVASRNLTAGDVVAALRAQNVQVASGVLNQPPVPEQGAYQLNVETLGRLSDPRQFGNIVVKTDDDGRVTRLEDVARVELAAQDYTANGYLDERPAVPLLDLPAAGLERAGDGRPPDRRRWRSCRRTSRRGCSYDIVYNPTEFIAESVGRGDEDDLGGGAPRRHRRHPVPADLAGGDHPDRGDPDLADRHLHRHGGARLFAEQPVAVRPGARHRHRRRRRHRRGGERRAAACAPGCRRKEAAHRTMDEVGGALIAIALVLCAVFIPAALIGGIQGQFFRQFAVTIAAATVISAFVSLTLSPALCAHPAEAACRTHASGRRSPLLRPVTRVLRRLQPRFRPAVARLWRADAAASCASRPSMLVVYGGLIALTGWQFARAPTGFIPEQDQGYLITVIQLPPGASLARTDAVVRQATQIILGHGGHRACRAVRRLRRRDLHQRLQRRRDLLRLRALRGARRRRV